MNQKQREKRESKKIAQTGEEEFNCPRKKCPEREREREREK